MGDESNTADESSDGLQKVIRSFRSFSVTAIKLNDYVKLGLAFGESFPAVRKTSDVVHNGPKLTTIPRQRSASAPFISRQSSINVPVDSVLSCEHMLTIYSWLPARIAIRKPSLIFSTAKDGTSISNFYNQCDRFEPTLIIVKTYSASSRIFGAYCSTAWENRKTDFNDEAHSYFGTGESFLFQLPVGGAEAVKYSWIGEDSDEPTNQLPYMFQLGTGDHLQIGGGGGTGLCILNPMTSGYSEHCETFNNAPLAGPNQREFECHTVEMYTFI